MRGKRGRAPRIQAVVAETMPKISPKQVENEPKQSLNVVQTPEAEPEVTQQGSIEELAELWRRSPGSYREGAQIFRAQEGAPQRAQRDGWIGDIPCSELHDARRVIAKHRYGGIGLYQVVLLDSATGNRARVGYARIEVDMRESTTPAATTAPAADSAVLEMIRGLERRLESAQRAPSAAPAPGIDPMVWEMMNRASTSRAEGYNAGFADGLRIGNLEGKATSTSSRVAREATPPDLWNDPEVVRSLVREVGSVFRPGAPTSSPVSVPGRAASTIVDAIKEALEVGMSAAQTVRMVRVLRGDDVLRHIVVNAQAILADAMQAPELQQLLQLPDTHQWLADLQAALLSTVGSPGGRPGE